MIQVEGDATFDRVAAHVVTGGRREKRISGVATGLTHPRSQHPNDPLSEGDASFLAALSGHVEILTADTSNSP